MTRLLPLACPRASRNRNVKALCILPWSLATLLQHGEDNFAMFPGVKLTACHLGPRAVSHVFMEPQTFHHLNTGGIRSCEKAARLGTSRTILSFSS